MYINKHASFSKRKSPYLLQKKKEILGQRGGKLPLARSKQMKKHPLWYRILRFCKPQEPHIALHMRIWSNLGDRYMH